MEISKQLELNAKRCKKCNMIISDYNRVGYCPKCYCKEYNKNHKDKIRKQHKEYYIKNKDKFKEYYKKNREKIREQKKEYYIKLKGGAK